MAIARNFFGWLVEKIRRARFALSSRVSLLNYGGIYLGSYRNWKHDPKPLIFIMYSGPTHTHGIQIHYMNRPDQIWFARFIYMIRRGGQIIDGFTLYKVLKMHRMSIVRTCYRMYFTSMLNMRLVSAGMTSLDKMVYTSHREPFIIALNEIIKPSELEGGPQIAYSPAELRERITTAAVATDIRTRRVSPIRQPPPWMRR